MGGKSAGRKSAGDSDTVKFVLMGEDPPLAYNVSAMKGDAIVSGTAPDLEWVGRGVYGALLHGMTMTITPVGRDPWNHPPKDWRQTLQALSARIAIATRQYQPRARRSPG